LVGDVMSLRQMGSWFKYTKRVLLVNYIFVFTQEIDVPDF